MNYSERRKRLRAVLSGAKCISPAAVHDPLSACVARSVGYEIAMFWGAAASQIGLGAPDLILLTLTEFAQQIRRITRASDLSLIVDADHGYGNALNVMRTVQELEHAGVSALSIEDTVLPAPFGETNERGSLISLEEGAGKIRAAVTARSDPSLVIMARTSSLVVEGVDAAVIRAKAYMNAGADMLQIVGRMEELTALEAIHAATPLPMAVGLVSPKIKREDLAARGARISHLGQQPLFAAIKALQDTYAYLYKGGAPAGLKDKMATPQEMEQLVKGSLYKQWQQDYLR